MLELAVRKLSSPDEFSWDVEAIKELLAVTGAVFMSLLATTIGPGAIPGILLSDNPCDDVRNTMAFHSYWSESKTKRKLHRSGGLSV